MSLPDDGAHRRTPPELWEKLKPLARQMRHEPTRAEDHLWQSLRRHQLDGAHFRRQHSLDRFIVDFFCYEVQLIVEVDGEIHQYTVEEDALRQAFLESRGLKVLRFTNEAVLYDLDKVLEAIRVAVKEARSSSGE